MLSCGRPRAAAEPVRAFGGRAMKRVIVILNGVEYINIPADRMEVTDTELRAWNGNDLVAYVDTSSVVCAHLSEVRA